MKKFVAIFAAVVLMLSCFTACGSENVPTGAADGDIQIVATIFPEYDWIMNVLGENPAVAEVTLLLDNGVDLHSYQPTADDVLKISTCDLFVYVGGESDEWVDNALKEAVNKDMVVINLLDELGAAVKEEEVVEGMECEEEEEPEYDEHVWLSLKNAKVLVESIAEGLQKVDPDNGEVYAANAAAYEEKLGSLDADYSAAVADAGTKTLLFGDRFPFRYLVDDYDIDYYAAFVGCSAASEASFETITFLAKKADELGLGSVMTIEGADHRIAESIIRNTAAKNQQILVMDSMQGTTAEGIKNGATYLGIMESNLDVLKEALK